MIWAILLLGSVGSVGLSVSTTWVGSGIGVGEGWDDSTVFPLDRVSFCQIPENVALDFNS